MIVAGERELLSVVVPAYNEEDNVARVHERLREVLEPLDVDWELIFAVDPCTDRTEVRIDELRERDPRVKMLRFSRRFGQPMATLAGHGGGGRRRRRGHRLRPAGSARVDSRATSTAGATATTSSTRSAVPARGRRCQSVSSPRSATGSIKRIAEVEIPPNTGDFRLMSRRVVDHVVALNESHGFLRGLVGLVGFPQTAFSTTATRGRPGRASTTASGARW